MLRVWGGGFYEDERFYDLCDRYGILVWQDFIFSCSVYPLDDPAFVENVRVEVVENVRRLRHRASLALWCGNNEMEQGWVEWGWNGPELAGPEGRLRHVLPPHAARVGARRKTLTTPTGPARRPPTRPSTSPNGQMQGDAHYWDVWHGRKPFTAYRNQYPRFMSEFGFQSLPPLATIRTYAAEADWNMTSYVMEQHQKNDSGNALMVGQMPDTFRMPKDFASLVYLSMVLQAEGIRYGVEHWRRHTDRVAGTLYWQLNDCWPVASWSSIDYFGRWKALHYAARRFYAPVLLSIEDAPPCQSIYLSSDLLEDWQGEVRWRLTTLDGTLLDEGRRTARVGAQRVATVERLDFARFLDDDSRRELVVHGGTVAGRCVPCPPGRLLCAHKAPAAGRPADYRGCGAGRGRARNHAVGKVARPLRRVRAGRRGRRLQRQLLRPAGADSGDHHGAAARRLGP